MRYVTTPVNGSHKKAKPAFNHEAIGLGDAELYCSKYAKFGIAISCDRPTRSSSVILHDAEEAVNGVGFTEQAFPDPRHCERDWKKRADLPWLDVSMRMLSKLHREWSAKVMEIETETETMLAAKVVVLFWCGSFRG